MGKLHQAIEYFKQVLEKEPHVVISRYHMGVSYARLGKFNEAIDEFEMFLKDVPASAAAYYNLGQGLL